MKKLLNQLDKAFENKIRLGIMSALMVNDYADFNTLKELLEITDGNLATHIKALEKREYISVHKEFLAKKPHTKYAATEAGRSAFIRHIKAIEQLLQ